MHHVADQADVDLLAVDDGATTLSREQPRVLSGDADREWPVLVEQADDVALHLADEHHSNNVHRLRGGDTQPTGEHLVDAEPIQMRVDLRPAAVHDDHADPGVAQEDDVFGERAPKRLVGHCMTAVLHHHGSAVKPLQPRQRLHEHPGLGQRLFGPGHVEYAEFSCT